MKERKSFFTHPDEHWTGEATELSREVSRLIWPEIQKWSARGYALREISQLIAMVVDDLALSELMVKQHQNAVHEEVPK